MNLPTILSHASLDKIAFSIGEILKADNAVVKETRKEQLRTLVDHWLKMVKDDVENILKVIE